MFSFNLRFGYSVFIESDKHFQLSNDSLVQLGAEKYRIRSPVQLRLRVLKIETLLYRGSNCV